MKIKLMLTCLVSAILINSCNEKATEPENTLEIVVMDYFSANTGSVFFYRNEKQEAGAVYDSIGVRKSELVSRKDEAGYEYLEFIESIVNLGIQLPVSKLNYRMSNGYLEIPAEIEEIKSLIPDSIQQKYYVSLEADEYFTAIKLPFGNREWNAYSINAVFAGILKKTILSCKASYQGTELLNIKGNSVTADKVKYVITLTYPDPQNPYNEGSYTNPINFVNSTIEADAWYALGLGMVKIKGALIGLDAITQGTINFQNINTNMSQTMFDYSIK